MRQRTLCAKTKENVLFSFFQSFFFSLCFRFTCMIQFVMNDKRVFPFFFVFFAERHKTRVVCKSPVCSLNFCSIQTTVFTCCSFIAAAYTVHTPYRISFASYRIASHNIFYFIFSLSLSFVFDFYFFDESVGRWIGSVFLFCFDILCSVWSVDCGSLTCRVRCIE